MIRQYELVERVRAYDPEVDEDALNRAYVFSMKAHGAQKRASGDPYFSHPVEVAGILSELKLDAASIVTGLLHDTVEDTVATLEEIERRFGAEVARLVDGVTKLSLLALQSTDTRQAENFRKFLVASSKDIRVLLVKLADRLHNMRTLHHVDSAAKRRRVAAETMEIYAPLAERIGMDRIRSELEDLAFAQLHPDAASSIEARLEAMRQSSDDLIPRIVDSLRETLRANGLEVEVSGRRKQIHSIWRKMQRKNVEFEQLPDVIAFRVVVAEVEECYRALGIIHTAYAVVPEQFDDYISTPKMNGYRSLHTCVIGPERHRIEVQIRTRDMHRVAEYGVAAHWRYKHAGDRTDGRQYLWMRRILDILEQAHGAEEFLENTKLEMFEDQVFCFTPAGELVTLPLGATPVDFAYSVHSEIGDRCVGAKVNGRPMPLRTRLNNGDQIEILTSKTGRPSPAWEDMVVTGKARARIRRFIRNEQRAEFVRLGEAILRKCYGEAGYKPSTAVIKKALERFGAKTVDDLHAAVGRGQVTGAEVLAAVGPKRGRGRRVSGAEPDAGGDNVLPFAPPGAKLAAAGPVPVPIRGLIPGMAVHYGNCCHPLPGDRIVGIVTPGKGVSIHTADCESLLSFDAAPERWLDVAWDTDAASADFHIGRITIVVSNERGTLANLTTMIANHLGNINNLRITNRAPDFFEMMLDIEVDDAAHLTDIIAALRSTPTVTSVERARGQV